MKFDLKIRATRLRRLGWSINDIAKKVEISESTASLWCREIALTKEQKTRLEKRTGKKLQNFFRIVERQKKQRDRNKRLLMEKAAMEIGKLSKREKFIAGIALYWAEGFKHVSEKRLGFCNSDPLMIKFQMDFWKECLDVGTEEITARLSLNERFREETSRLEKFWSNYLNLPLSQFTKPFYQKSKTVKDYGNSDGYRGVLRIHVRKSSIKMIEMRGYIKGLTLQI